jgi:hypothetical protein
METELINLPNIRDFFFTTFEGKALALVVLSLAVILLFGIILKSISLSCRLFINPGTLDELDTKYKRFFGIIQILAGMVFIGAVASIMTEQIFKFSEQYKNEKNFKLVKEGFETQQNIGIGPLLKKNKIDSRSRLLDLEDTSIQLNISKEEVIKSIGSKIGLRLRVLKENKEVVIEEFDANKSYGLYINRHSPITIVAPQNCADPFVHHFSSTIAKNIEANYISNEFYAHRCILKSRWLNFIQNKSYKDMTLFENNPIGDFKHDIGEVSGQTKMFIFISITPADCQNDVDITYSGFNDTYDISSKYEELQQELISFGLKSSIKQSENISPTNITDAVYNKYGKKTICLHVSQNILSNNDEMLYYKTVIATIGFINELK